MSSLTKSVLKDFRDTREQPKPIFVWGPTFLNNQNEIDESGDYHGTCVASKAAGRINGVTRANQIIMMKKTEYMSDTLWAWGEILRRVLQDPNHTMSVVVFPHVGISNPLTARSWSQIKNYMRKLFAADVVIVGVAGNDGAQGSPVVNTQPSVWEDDTFPMIVAGAVDNNGVLQSFSQGGPHVNAWAPGFQVDCAGSPKAISSGTSFSAPMVCYPFHLQRPLDGYPTDQGKGRRFDCLLSQSDQHTVRNWTRPNGL